MRHPSVAGGDTRATDRWGRPPGLPIATHAHQRRQRRPQPHQPGPKGFAFLSPGLSGEPRATPAAREVRQAGLYREWPLILHWARLHMASHRRRIVPMERGQPRGAMGSPLIEMYCSRVRTWIPHRARNSAPALKIAVSEVMKKSRPATLCAYSWRASFLALW